MYRSIKNQNQQISSEYIKIIYLLFGFFIILFDQMTKYLALYYNATYLARFRRFLHLPPIKNYGVSLNLFDCSDNTLFFLFRAIGLLIICYFIYRAVDKHKNKKYIFGEIAVISGALSNLIDRCYHACVIDFIFINFPFFNYIAIANFADIAITGGCLFLIYELFIEDYEKIIAKL